MWFISSRSLQVREKRSRGLAWHTTTGATLQQESPNLPPLPSIFRAHLSKHETFSFIILARWRKSSCRTRYCELSQKYVDRRSFANYTPIAQLSHMLDDACGAVVPGVPLPILYNLDTYKLHPDIIGTTGKFTPPEDCIAWGAPTRADRVSGSA